ncbi:MAG: D-2-hydroxyacid dehydrogenase [Bacillota bacterium]
MHKIVIVDGYTTSSADLSWDVLNQYGSVVSYARTPKEKLIERVIDADIIISNKCIFDAEVLRALPNLKYIGLTSTGYNVVDCDVAKELGVVVTNVPAYSTESVVQLVFGLIIEMYTKVGIHNDRVKSGEWANCIDFCFYDKISELSGKTMGIIGYGVIGKRVAVVAKAFGMRVVVYNKGRVTDDGTEYVLDVNDLYPMCDIISLNCPQNAASTNMINSSALSKIKKGAIIINTARGGLVNEADVASALVSGQLGGFCCDVLSTEPPKADNPLLSAPNTIITPHIAWATKEARSRLIGVVEDNLKCFLNNVKQNIVNL